jgi:hypothetical protein
MSNATDPLAQAGLKLTATTVDQLRAAAADREAGYCMYDAGSAAGAGGVRAAVSELARTCLELYPPLLDRDQLAENAAKILLRAVSDSPEREEAAAGGALHRAGPHRAAWPSVLPENPIRGQPDLARDRCRPRAAFAWQGARCIAARWAPRPPPSSRAAACGTASRPATRAFSAAQRGLV